MLLKEIAPMPPVKDVKLTRQQTLNRLEKAGGIHLGGGSFGDVYAFDKPTKANTVFKYFSLSNENDGYLAFLRTFIHDQRRLNNPYLPRIYSLKLFKEPMDPDSESENEKKEQLFGRVEMERLVEIEDPRFLDVNLLKSLYEQMFYGSIPSIRSRQTQEDKDAVLANNILLEIVHNIKRALRADDPSALIKIKDPDLKNAIRYIKTAAARFSSYVDLHPGNVMWRITGTRPQLVITDPLV